MDFKQMIKSKGISQYRLAKEAKVGQTTISDLVSGKRKEPKLSTCIKIAEVLKVEVNDIYEAINGGK